jgi:GAF domain-containing protein
MAALCVFFVGVFLLLDRPWQWTWMVFEMVQAVVLLTIAYAFARKGHLAVSIYLTTITLNLTVIIGPALVEGMIVPGVLASLIAFIFARLLAGPTEKRVAALITCMALVAGIALASLHVVEILPIPGWIQVITAASGAVIVVLLIARILDLYDARYQTSLGQSEAYARELDMQRETLEQRTRELTRRSSHLEATAEVARDAASVLDQQTLLSQIVTLVSERFDFYHTGIFLLDASGQWAVLEAASSDGGQRMLARGHRLRVGHEGIVGYVTGRGVPRIALDVGSDAVFFDNPELPHTRSELALPLKARGEIIGALDVQSTAPQAFTDDDLAVLQTLADQVAMAISNARLFQQAQESLDAERRAYGQMASDAWAGIAHAQAGLGYRYDGSSVTRIRTHDTGVGSETHYRPNVLPELTLPVSLHDRVIAQINAHKPAETGEWSEEQIALMELLAEQLSVALEKARLYADSQRHAAREQLTREITDKVRAVPDIDAIARTAAEELAKALGGARGFVKLKTEDLDSNGHTDIADA